MAFKYQVYYEHKANRLDFMEDELSDEEVARNRSLLLDDLRNHFDETGGAVEISSDGVIAITTSLSYEECSDVLAGYLSSLHLRARKLPRGR
jgi:hypothetical protein